MRNQFLVFLLLATILYPRFSAPARAQTGRRSPKVGLALSGGGARGAAHIGVLKALEKTGIRVDYIAGTSFGALIGGFYALGYSPERIEEIFASQNWNDLFSDSPDRRLSPLIQRKNFRYLGELTIREFNVELPAGLWGGQKLTEVLNYYTTTQEMLDSGYDYDRLRIPFRAVATDLLSGKQYIFRRGPMAEAMRASIAIPMMFTPVEKDDMLLADGGLANNLPADVVREMGAEVVIAVDVTSSLLKKEEVRTFFDVMEQTLSIQMKQSLDRNLKFADAVLKPELEGFSYSSYAQIREISARGEQAALAKRDELRKLAVDAKQETYPVKSVEPARPMLESVTFVGLTRLDASQLQRELRSRANRRMDPITVRGDLGRLYATRLFERVDFRLDRIKEDRYHLTYQVKEQPANTLGASMRYDPDYEFVGLAELNSRAVLGTPSTATLSSQFGGLDNHSAALRLIHPRIPFFFLEPTIQYRKQERLDLQDKTQVGRFTDARVGGQLMIGGTFFNRFEIAAGYRFDRAKISGVTTPDLQEGARNLAGLRLNIRRDTLDEQEYPRSGMLLELRADDRSKALGGDLSYSLIQADLQHCFSFSEKSTVGFRFGGIFSRGGLPFYDRLYIGGYNFSEMASRQFLGFARDELAARQGGLFAASYRRQLFSRPLSSVRRGFLHFQYNLAAISDQSSRPYGFTTYNGGGVGLLLDTMLGPMRFASGVGEGGRGKFYLSLGPSF